MLIKYRKVQRRVMNGPDKDMIKTYAVAKASYTCNEAKLSNLVAARTAMSDSEVSGMIRAMVWVARTELASGAIVQITGLGSLRISLQSEGVIDPDDFKAHHIKGARIVFTPSVQLKKVIQDLRFSKDNPLVIVETEDCDQQHVP